MVWLRKHIITLKISKIEGKYFTTSDHNKFTSKIVDTILKLGNK